MSRLVDICLAVCMLQCLRSIGSHLETKQLPPTPFLHAMFYEMMC